MLAWINHFLHLHLICDGRETILPAIRAFLALLLLALSKAASKTLCHLLHVPEFDIKSSYPPPKKELQTLHLLITFCKSRVTSARMKEEHRTSKSFQRTGENTLVCIELVIWVTYGLFVYLEIPIHYLGGVQVVQGRDDLCTVETRAVLWEHPFSRQMEKQLQDKQQGQDCNNYWFIEGN